MKKSGLADSPFFKTPGSDPVETNPSISIEKENRPSTSPTSKSKKDIDHGTVVSRNRDTMKPRYHDTIIDLVRRGVKDFGKEAATHRFTLIEKKAIADIIYTYKSRGVKTSENEITRIAVNFLVEDFRENGEESVLDKTLKALNG
jgi:hypothetical protein